MTASPLRSALLRKYNVPAPRYTSYPTVPYWDRTPSEEEWLHLFGDALTTAAAAGTGAAVYMHIPFCEQLCTFCGCNTRITKNHSVALPYIDLIHRELALYRQKLGAAGPLMKLAELHLGGGTPTFLNSEQLQQLLEPFFAQVDVQSDVECSAEVDPRVTTKEQLQTLSELGFKRLSLGIQDFDLQVQQTVNRVQPVTMVAELTATARTLGYHSINFDLIYGLPKQTLRSIESTFREVITMRPERIAFYAYAHVPWIKPAHRRFTEADLPGAEMKRQLYELGRDMLEDAGYAEIGMDHFALPSDPLWQAGKVGSLHRNFMGYIPRQVSPQLGLGVSAISDSWTAFMQNEKSLEKYKARIEEGRLPILRGHVLNDEDLSLRRHILNLMTKFATEWSASEGEDEFFKAIPARLAELHRDGLIDIDERGIRVRDEGRAFMRNISMAFDARLSRNRGATELFSRSI